ncbi:MAG TPA: hypothetical protein VGF45_14660, partial [Polyangia bacterium]
EVVFDWDTIGASASDTAADQAAAAVWAADAGPVAAPAESNGEGQAGEAPAEGDFVTSWNAVRDANIRPYVEWLPSKTVSLPAIQSRPVRTGPPPSESGRRGDRRDGRDKGRPNYPGGKIGGKIGGKSGGKMGGTMGANAGGKLRDGDGEGRRKRKRRGRRRDRGGEAREMRDNREPRGPRLPGMYNPGGD